MLETIVHKRQQKGDIFISFSFRRLWQYFTKIGLGQISHNFICNYWYAAFPFISIEYRRCSSQILQMDLLQSMSVPHLSGCCTATNHTGTKKATSIGYV